MHLPDDTIVNQNVLNIYLSGNYDVKKGVDPIYLKVAEGVALLNRKHTKEQLCTRIKFFGHKTNERIEKYVKGLLVDSKYSKTWDVFVFVKVNSNSDFMVFGISWSDRMFNKLQNYDNKFKKNYAISVAVNWFWK